jgi:hypothetical protein
MFSTSLLRVGHWITTHPYPGHEDEDPRGRESAPRGRAAVRSSRRRDPAA